MDSLENVIARMEPHIRFDTLFIGSNFAHKVHFRPETLVMHRTLMNALCSQMALPMLFFAPIIIHVIVTFFWDPPIFMDYQVYGLIGWQPVFDPLITIYSVIPYRKAAIKFFLQPTVMERRRKIRRSTVCVTKSRNLATELDDGRTARKTKSSSPSEGLARR
ncbi:unnamed protein product [Toxocara canis]|uniref:G protein-coupled receptor n=1 Tax=Toxocara canis TaxID=6265 RepID=A0A183UF59_TOXCA|nr:unnamed protein product [Toxocara canis]